MTRLVPIAVDSPGHSSAPAPDMGNRLAMPNAALTTTNILAAALPADFPFMPFLGVRGPFPRIEEGRNIAAQLGWCAAAVFYRSGV
jgi:hypothetical protein